MSDTDIREILGVKSPQESVEFLNFLPYGDPGVGKTWLCGSAADHAETSPVLLIDVEGGVTTLRHRPDVDVIQVRTMKEVEETVQSLQKDIHQYYRTVVIDSLTELQKLDMRFVMQEQFKKAPEKTDVYVPSPREWGKSGERIRLIVRALRDLPCHTIMTSLASYERDEKTNTTLITPSLPGKLKAELPGFFDIVGFMQSVDEKKEDDTVEIIRTIQFVKSRRVTAKDRTSSLGSLMRNPSIPSMWELINAAPTNGNGAAPTGKKA